LQEEIKLLESTPVVNGPTVPHAPDPDQVPFHPAWRPTGRTAHFGQKLCNITRLGAEVGAHFALESSVDAVPTNVKVIFRNCEVRDLEYRSGPVFR